MSRPTVIWESRSPVVADSYSAGRILRAANGGNAYDIQAALALTATFDFRMSPQAVKRPGEGMIGYWARMQRNRTNADIVVREPFPVVFGRFVKGVKYIAVIHHIDIRKSKGSVRHRWYFSRLKKRLTAVDRIVTVSEHWADYLRGIGCKDVRVIYNSFDTSKYRIEPAELKDFKHRFALPEDRPIVHIGNASRQKGVHAVYKALSNSGYHLVMSGPQNQATDIPVQYLGLDHSDYVRLLHCCAAVISMSEMEEGWNRIAHEALLCGTPVIGNGSGGMMELLQGARQAIVTHTSQLPGVLENVLANRQEFSADGQEFVMRFDLEYFKSAWKDAVTSLINPAA